MYANHLRVRIPPAQQGFDWQDVQGYLAHQKERPPRTLHLDFAGGPMEFLEGGWFLMSEVPR